MKLTVLFFVLAVAYLTNGPADACEFLQSMHEKVYEKIYGWFFNKNSTESESTGSHETETDHEKKQETSRWETGNERSPLLPKPSRHQQQKKNERPGDINTGNHKTPPAKHQEKPIEQKNNHNNNKERPTVTYTDDDIPESHAEVVPALSQPEKDDIVTTLNDARAKARGTAINKLAWDHKLEEGADGVAKECKHMSNEENKPIVILHHYKNKERGPTVGLTFYIGSKDGQIHRPIVSKAIVAFMTGKQHYSTVIESGDCKSLEETKAKDCTHYKQVVSANTTHVGCAMVKCPSANAWFGGALNNEDKTPSFRLLCEFVPPYSEEGPAYIPVKRGQNPGDDCREPRKADGHGLCAEEPKADTDPDADIRLNEIERGKILTVLNGYRKGVRATAMNKLYWSNKLEKHAIITARGCTQLVPIGYYKDIASTGISYVIPTSVRPTIEKAFAYITVGKEPYDKHNGICELSGKDEQHNCLFYKQIVWAATNLVGCVMTECTVVPGQSWFGWNSGAANSEENAVVFRMFCLYHSPYNEKGTAYVEVANNGKPGSDCEDLYHRKDEDGLCGKERGCLLYRGARSVIEGYRQTSFLVDFALEEEPEMDLDHDATAALTEKEQENILDMLNKVRQGIQAAAMNKLYWSKYLAAHAEDLGKQCKAQQIAVVNERHEDNKKGDSESISYRVEGLQRPSIRTALYYIHTGKPYYVGAKGDCKKSQKPGCHHYKQVVTAETSDIGCAMVKCPQPKSAVVGVFTGSQDVTPSYRMLCEYRPPFNENSIAYENSNHKVKAGSKCIDLKPNGHGLCVVELIESEKREIEKILNEARADAKSKAMNKLTWSTDLENAVTKVVSQCEAKTAALELKRTSDKIGLVTYRTKGKRPSIENALDYAIKGNEKYKSVVEKGDCNAWRQGEDCMPYKQAVTGATTKVGCAMVKCEEDVGTVRSDIIQTYHMLCAYQPAYEDSKPAYDPAETDDEVGTGCDQYGKKPNRQGLCDEELEGNESLDD